MSKAPAFQFYANDFMDATSTWEANAVGLYVRCLCKQWTHGSIPADLRILARAIHCDRSELESCWDVLGPKFIDQGDGTLKNRRLEEVRARQEEVSAKRSEAGKAGAIAKANAKANGQAKTQQRKVKEKEKENTEERREEGKEIQTLVWPTWAGEKTKGAWEGFKAYRKEEHGLRYKTTASEQRQLDLAIRYFPSGPQFVSGLEYAKARNWRFPVDPAEHKYPAAAEQPSTLKEYRL